MHLALGQIPTTLGNVGENLKSIEKAIEEAKNKSKEYIDLIAFPELFITGYNLRDNYHSVSELIPGNYTAQEGLLILAKKHDITILTGIVERSNKSLFNSAIMIGPEGYLGHCRKQYLPNFGPFEEKTYFGEVTDVSKHKQKKYTVEWEDGTETINLKYSQLSRAIEV